jgi:hypothetical protein
VITAIRVSVREREVSEHRTIAVMIAGRAAPIPWARSGCLTRAAGTVFRTVNKAPHIHRQSADGAAGYALRSFDRGAATERGMEMPGEALIALAQWAGQTVAAAAITDVWESARHKFARLFGRGDPRRIEAAERWLTETHEQLTAAQSGEVERVRAAQAQRWEGRFADLLDEDPGVGADLRELVKTIQAQLSSGTVSAADHSVAAGRDVNISADRGSVAAGTIHGNVSPPGPTSPGPATS